MTGFSRLLTRVFPADSGARRAPAAHERPALVAPGGDDAFVNVEVKNALRRHSESRCAGIHVSTSRGIVQLSGFVASRRVIAVALDTVRRVPGVRSVRNDMRIA